MSGARPQNRKYIGRQAAVTPSLEWQRSPRARIGDLARRHRAHDRVLPRPSAAEVWEVVKDASGWGEVYRRAAEVVGSTLAARKDFDRVVGHGDFHPGNLLFDEGRLSGVVDWSHAWIGPRNFDLSYCRTEIG